MPFSYCGSKRRLCAEISGLLDYDSTTIYAELFGGSAAVLLNKMPHDKEVYADMSLALCCFWRCMSDSDISVELIEKLYDSDYDRETFDSYRNTIDEVETSGKRLSDMSGGDIIEIAAACFIVHSMSRDSAGWRYNDSRIKTHEAYLRSVDRLIEVSGRFEGVTVEHADAIDLLCSNRFNNPGVMLYIDPVYLPETGRGNSRNDKLYRHKFAYVDHIVMLELIRGMKCKIVLSGYVDNTELYDRYLMSETGSCRQWARYEIDAVSSVARGDKHRTEILWVNYH
jgi:site-specific DNA-adenine methylase